MHGRRCPRRPNDFHLVLISCVQGKPQTGRERLIAAARVEARKGNDALRAFREGLTPQQDGALSPILSELDRIACNADAADDGFPGFDAPHEKAA